MMKLRHGKNFGTHASTCWRLLFTFALFPWMRKYRLSPDDIEVTSFRFAAMRMWTGRMPRHGQHEATIRTTSNALDEDDESDAKETIQSLREELARLQSENDMLRHAVYQPKAAPHHAHRKYLSTSMPHVIE